MYEYPLGKYKDDLFYRAEFPKWQSAVAEFYVEVLMQGIISEGVSAYVGGKITETLLFKLTNKLRELAKKGWGEWAALERRVRRLEAEARKIICFSFDVGEGAGRRKKKVEDAVDDLEKLNRIYEEKTQLEEALRKAYRKKELLTLPLFFLQFIEWGVEWLMWSDAFPVMRGLKHHLTNLAIDILRILNNAPPLIDKTGEDMQRQVEEGATAWKLIEAFLFPLRKLHEFLADDTLIREKIEERNRESADILLRLRRAVAWRRRKSKLLEAQEKWKAERLRAGEHIEFSNTYGSGGFKVMTGSFQTDDCKPWEETVRVDGIPISESISTIWRVGVEPIYHFYSTEWRTRDKELAKFYIPSYDAEFEYTRVRLFSNANSGNEAITGKFPNILYTNAEEGFLLEEEVERLECRKLEREEALFWLGILKREGLVKAEGKKIKERIRQKYAKAIRDRLTQKEERLRMIDGLVKGHETLKAKLEEELKQTNNEKQKAKLRVRIQRVEEKLRELSERRRQEEEKANKKIEELKRKMNEELEKLEKEGIPEDKIEVGFYANDAFITYNISKRIMEEKILGKYGSGVRHAKYEVLDLVLNEFGLPVGCMATYNADGRGTEEQTEKRGYSSVLNLSAYIPDWLSNSYLGDGSVVVVKKTIYRRKRQRIASYTVKEESYIVRTEKACKRLKKVYMADRVKVLRLRNAIYLLREDRRQRQSFTTWLKTEEEQLSRKVEKREETNKQIMVKTTEDGILAMEYNSKDRVLYIYECVFTDRAVKALSGRYYFIETEFRELVRAFSKSELKGLIPRAGTKRPKLVCTF